MRQRNYRGKALQEYGFIVALIAIFCVAAFLLFGNNLDRVVNLVKGEMGTHVNSAKYMEARQNAIDTGTGVYPVQLADGTVINVPAVLVNPTTTAGSNGGDWSLTLTAALEELANQLQSSDPQLAALIRDLARAGYNVANAERIILSQCGSQTSCQNLQGPGGSGLLVSVGVLDYNASATQVSNYLAANPGAIPPELQRLIGVNNAIIVDIAGGFEATLGGTGTDVVLDPRVQGNSPATIDFHANSNCGVQAVYANCFP